MVRQKHFLSIRIFRELTSHIIVTTNSPSLGHYWHHCQPQYIPWMETFQYFQVLPAWTGEQSGSLSVKLRTSEPNGLIFYNRGEVRDLGRTCKNNFIFLPPQSGHFFGLELSSGHLYLHLNLGNRSVKIRAHNQRLDDSGWHRIDLERTGRTGRISVDNSHNNFNIPGKH